MVFLLSLTIAVHCIINVITELVQNPSTEDDAVIVAADIGPAVKCFTPTLTVTPFRATHPFVYHRHQLLRQRRFDNYSYSSLFGYAARSTSQMDYNVATGRVGATANTFRRQSDVIYEQKFGKEFHFQVCEQQGAHFLKVWESFSQECRLKIGDFVKLLVAAPGVLSFVVDFVDDVKDTTEAKSAALYLTDSLALFITSKMGEKKNANQRFTNISLKECFRSGTGELKGLSANSISFRSGEFESFVNKIPSICKSLIAHYKKYHQLHRKFKPVTPCEFCTAMASVGEDGPLVFSSINLFKPGRSVVTLPPSKTDDGEVKQTAKVMRGSGDAEVAAAEEEEDDDTGSYTPQSLLDVVWPYLDRFLRGDQQGALMLYIRGRAMMVNPKDVVKNRELTRPRHIAKPTLPNFGSLAVTAPPTAAAAAAAAAPNTGAAAAASPSSSTQVASNDEGVLHIPPSIISGTARRKANRPTRLDIDERQQRVKSLFDMEAVEASDEEEAASDLDDPLFQAISRGKQRLSREKSAMKKRLRDEEEEDDDYDLDENQNISGLIDDTPLVINTQAEDAARAKMIEESKRDYFQLKKDYANSNADQALRSSIASVLRKHPSHPPENANDAMSSNMAASLRAYREQTGALHFDDDSCEAIHGSQTQTQRPNFDPKEIFVSSDEESFLHPPPEASK